MCNIDTIVRIHETNSLQDCSRPKFVLLTIWIIHCQIVNRITHCFLQMHKLPFSIGKNWIKSKSYSIAHKHIHIGMQNGELLFSVYVFYRLLQDMVSYLETNEYNLYCMQIYLIRSSLLGKPGETPAIVVVDAAAVVVDVTIVVVMVSCCTSKLWYTLWFDGSNYIQLIRICVPSIPSCTFHFFVFSAASVIHLFVGDFIVVAFSRRLGMVCPRCGRLISKVFSYYLFIRDYVRLVAIACTSICRQWVKRVQSCLLRKNNGHTHTRSLQTSMNKKHTLTGLINICMQSKYASGGFLFISFRSCCRLGCQSGNILQKTMRIDEIAPRRQQICCLFCMSFHIRLSFFIWPFVRRRKSEIESSLFHIWAQWYGRWFERNGGFLFAINLIRWMACVVRVLMLLHTSSTVGALYRWQSIERKNQRCR